MEINISEFTTNRLSIYLRCLASLEAAGVETVSSQQLADEFHLNSAQIRKDLAYFGEFGIRGIGYNVRMLRGELIKILGLDKTRNVGIVGAGNLGRALSSYKGFSREGFKVVALFDNNQDKIGTITSQGHKIYSIDNLKRVSKELDISICIVAVPALFAPEVISKIESAGIDAVLNFSPVQVKPSSNLIMKNVDMKIQLEALAFSLSRKSG